MATHSSILAWRIPWTEEPGGLPSTESQRVTRDLSSIVHAHTHSCSLCGAHSLAPSPPWPLAQSLSEGWTLLSKPSAVVTSSVSSSPRQSRCSLSYRTCQCLGFLIYKVGIVADIGNVRKHPLKKENIHENNYPTH